MVELKREPGQIVVRVAQAPGVAAELRALVAAERVCCPFVQWRVVERDGWYELQIQGTSDGLDAIAGLLHGQ